MPTVGRYLLICEGVGLGGGIKLLKYYSDFIMNPKASQITGVSIVHSTVCSGADQRKHQSFASLAFVRRIHRSPVNPPHKGPVTQKMFLFDDVIINKTLLWGLADWLYSTIWRWELPCSDHKSQHSKLGNCFLIIWILIELIYETVIEI